jgi:mono/diheme cytochrome c family protein
MSRFAIGFAASALILMPSLGWCEDMGDAHQGENLAKGVCAECHAVEKGARRSPNGIAPSFESLVHTPGMTATALRVALRSPHQKMPNLRLSNDQVDDLYAYLQTLK